jgi:hypothetical protein
MGDDVRMGTEDIIETLRKKFERVSEVRWTPLSRPWIGQFKIEATGVKVDHTAAGRDGPAAS